MGVRQTINVAAVRAPAFGTLRKSILQDISILTNTTVITEEAGLLLKNVTLDTLGRARNVTITKTTTTIVTDQTEKEVKIHCNGLRKQISLTDDSYEKEKLQNRI